MRQCLKATGYVACLLALSSSPLAQSSAAGDGIVEGLVTDPSGQPVTDATVDLTSPALIEGRRRATTGENGRYSFVGLRPGTYTVTVAGKGFHTVARAGITVSGARVVDVSVAMEAGTGPIEETVTVTAERPSIDLRNTRRQIVITQDLLDSVPLSRFPNAMAAVLPGVNCGAGASTAIAFEFSQTCGAHGGRGDDQRITMDGMNLGSIQVPGISNFIPNIETAQEIVVVTAASGVESPSGGISIDVIPRDGGDTLQGSTFVTAAFERMQSRNLSQELADQGMQAPDTLERTIDINPAVGGPIARGTLWFFTSVRRQAARIRTNQYANRNAFQLDSWAYAADLARQEHSRNGRWMDYYARVTWQASARHRIAGVFSDQDKCECVAGVSASRTREAGFNDRNPVQRTLQIEWRLLRSSRFLFEVAGQKRDIEQGFMPLTEETSGVGAERFQVYRRLIGVTILDGAGTLPNNFSYRGPGPLPPALAQDSSIGGPFTLAKRPSYSYSGSLTYAGGGHTVIAGVRDTSGRIVVSRYMTTLDPIHRPLRYTFRNPSTPQSVTVFTGTPDMPATTRDDLDHDMGVYVQDTWAARRLTLQVGARLDWYKSSYPEQTIPPTPYGRAAAMFPSGTSLDLKDVTPRVGVAYDLSGARRTALTFGLNKYVLSQGAPAGIGAGGNPLASGRGITNNFSRLWNDADGDFFVDCDVYRLDPHGECTNRIAAGVFNATPTELADDAARFGWGRRSFNWELSLGIQHQPWSGTALDVSYFRRWYGNHLAIDNTACVDAVSRTGCVEPGNFTTYSITAPVDSRLPGGGGFTVTGFSEPDCSGASASCGNATAAQIAALSPLNQLVRVEDLGARQIERWEGLDISLTSHRNRLSVMAGSSTGRRYSNACEVLALLPEVLGPGRPLSACEVTEPVRTAFKGLVTYAVPRFDALPDWLGTTLEELQLSGVVQDLPGNEMSANYNMTNAEFARPCPSADPGGDTSCSTLGRFLANTSQESNTRNLTVILPATLYDARVRLIDLRIGKRVRVAGTSMTVNLDLLNVVNANTVLARNNTLGQHTMPGAYAAARQRQADGSYNSLWVPTSVLLPRLAKISLTLDF